MLDDVQFFYPTKEGYETKKTGAAFPFQWRTYQTNTLIFQLAQETDSTAVRTYYFRVQSNFPIELPLKVATWKPFFEQHHRNDVAYGFYFGLMFVMGLYNLFVFVSVRDKTYLYYVGYVFSITVLYGTFKGYSFEFLWKNYESINFFVPILASIPPIFGILFATSFLHTRIYTPKLHKIAYFLFALFVFCILLNLFGDYTISAAVSQLGAMLFVLYFLLIGIVCLFRKNKAARFFLVAWICYIVAVIIFILQINGVLNSNTFTSNSVLFGSAIEVILLSFALADKIATLKKEKETSLLANEKLIKEQKEELAIKVQEQTKELLETNEELRNSSEELHAINDELQKTLSVVNFQKAEIDLKHGELQNSYRSVNVLSEIGKQVNATLDLRTIIRTVYANINKLMAAEIFGIGIHRENEKLLEFDGFMENGEELPFHTEILTDNSRYAVRCFLTSHEIILHHVSEEVPNYEVLVGLKPESMLYLPLMYQNKTLGVITVQSLQPHAYNDYHLTMLRSIASYTSSALDNALSYREIEKNKAEIEKKNEDITASISYAQRIQNAMLPTQTQLSEVLGKNNFFVFFKPRDIVSGDFYWTATMRGDLVIAVADCTGHGVPGAFVSMIGSSFLDEIVLSNGFANPTTILKHLNKKIIAFFKQKTIFADEGISDGMDIAILSLYKSKNAEPNNNMRFEKALFAGAMNPLYYVQNQTLTEIKATKRSIGGNHTLEKINFESTEIDLSVPTTFYLFSDGYQDQFGGEKNKKFMTANFRRLIDSVHTQTFEQQHQLLETTLKNWQGTEKQTDDICVLGFSV
jgi:serine phosphatase RsbU (regulator of sigma subunit)